MKINMHCPNCKKMTDLEMVTSLPDRKIMVKCPECDKTNIVGMGGHD